MYEATADRDHLVELIRKYSGVFQDEAEAARLEELEIGVPIERITTVVDVRAFVGAKRAAMREHASQIGETSWFLTMPDDVFLASFGYALDHLEARRVGHLGDGLVLTADYELIEDR